MANSGKPTIKEFTLDKLFAVALAAVLITAAITSIVNSSGGMIKNAYAQSNDWYVGKGAQPNNYYTYKIQTDVDNGQPFLMTIYFKQFNSTGGYWVAPALSLIHI